MKFQKSSLLFILFFCAFFLPSVIFSTKNAIKFDDLNYHVQYWIFSIPQIIIFFFSMSLFRPLECYSIQKLRLRSIVTGICMGILAIISLFIFSFILSLLSFLIPIAPEKIVYGAPNAIFYLCSIPTTLFIAYREELFFRSWFVIELEENGFNNLTAGIISSLIFGLMHGYEGFVGIFFTSVLGFFFWYLLKKFKNIHICSFAHAIYNLIVIYLSSLIISN